MADEKDKPATLEPPKKVDVDKALEALVEKPAAKPVEKALAPATEKPAAPAPAPAAAAPAAAKPAPPKPAPAAPAPKPADAKDKPIVLALAAAVPGSVVAATEFVGETTIEVAVDKLVEACRWLKREQKFDYLVDLTAVDWKDRAPRFDVVYWMHSFPKNHERLRLKVKVAEIAPTISVVWETANWMEREVIDLFGITFEGHPDPRRILTWEGFNGHPLRKDFPVEGIDTGAAIYPERYPEGGGPSPNDTNKKVVS